MNTENKIDIINEKISSLAEKETIENKDLLINGNEKITDLIFNIEDQDLKFNLLADLMLLNIKFNKADIFEIVKTNDKNIIFSVLDNNKNDKETSLNIVNAAIDSDISKENFLMISRSVMNIVVENSRDIIKNYVNEKSYISEKDNDKMFLLLLVHDKSPVSEEDKKEFEEFLSFSMAEKANPKLFKMLLSTKINMHSVNELNENGLFYLNGKNNEVIKEKYKLLTENGIDKSLKNVNGQTYLEKNTKLDDSINRIEVEKKRKVAP